MADALYGENLLIDTEIERSKLEYRPKVTYQKETVFTVDFPVETSTQDSPVTDGPDVFVPEEIPAIQYESFVENEENIQLLISLVEDKIKDMEIAITPQDLQRLNESSPIHLPTRVQNDFTIDFLTYKGTFADPENPGNALIQDLINEHAEDVDGTFELEIYEDLMELQLTMKEGYYLFRQSVLKNYIDGEIPAAPEKDEAFTKQIDEAVKKQADWFKNVQKTYENQEKTYYDSLRTEYGTPDFFKKSEEFVKRKRPFDVALREEKTLKEVGSLVEHLLNGTENCADTIKSRLVIGGEINKEEVMKVLENQAATTEQLAELMKLTQLSLKLQLNQQIQEKKQYRDVLKNINNLSRKQRAHDELLMAYELRNKMYLNMYDTLQHLESPSKLPGVETFLNNVAGGLKLVQDEYESFLQDIYLMYASEFEVRKEKIDKVIDKDNARAGYSLVLDYL